MSGPAPSSNPYWADDVKIGHAEGISPYLLSAQEWFESSWDPSAVSDTGAFGLSQFEPGTAATYGVKQGDSAADVDSQITGQARYLRTLYSEEGSWTRALEAYNTGPAGNLASASGYASEIISLAGDHATAPPAKLTSVTGDLGSGIIGPVGSAALGLVGGKVESKVDKTVVGIAGKLAFVAAGVGLVVLGIFKTASPNTPVVKTIADKAKQAGTTAAETVAA